MQSGGEELFIALEERGTMNVSLISTVGSSSIEWPTTNGTKNHRLSLRVTSRVRRCQRHISPRKAQPPQRLLGFNILEPGGQAYWSEPDVNPKYMKMTKDVILEGSSQQANKDVINRRNGQGP